MEESFQFLSYVRIITVVMKQIYTTNFNRIFLIKCNCRIPVNLYYLRNNLISENFISLVRDLKIIFVCLPQNVLYANICLHIIGHINVLSLFIYHYNSLHINEDFNKLPDWNHSLKQYFLWVIKVFIEMIGSDCKAFKNVFSLLPSTLFLVFRAHIEIKLDYISY